MESGGGRDESMILIINKTVKWMATMRSLVNLSPHVDCPP